MHGHEYYNVNHSRNIFMIKNAQIYKSNPLESGIITTFFVHTKHHQLVIKIALAKCHNILVSGQAFPK